MNPPPTPSSVKPTWSPRRAPYGRHSRPRETLPGEDALTIARQQEQALRPYDGPTYYGKPALKPGHYRWLIVEYFFVGGMAGAAQVVATVADFCGQPEDRIIVRHGRYLALAGALVSPVLLIADLYSPERFYNMLRIYRGRSPMSFGAWSLAAFGAFSGVVAAIQALEDTTGSRWPRSVARVFAIPAAAAGVVMACYTGALLAATSVPLWAASSKTLPALFGASATATAVAALSLSSEIAGAATETVERLEKLELVAGASEVALTAAFHKQIHDQGVAKPLRQAPLNSVYMLGAVGAGMLVPLAIQGTQKLLGRRSSRLSSAAAISTLVGGFLLRTAIVFAGRQSATSPDDYFHFTQAEQH